MHAVRREIVILPLFAVRNDRRACGFKLFNGAANRIFIETSEVRITLTVALCDLSMRSMGLGILPIGSGGMVIGVGLAILTAFRVRGTLVGMSNLIPFLQMASFFLGVTQHFAHGPVREMFPAINTQRR